MDKRMSNTKTKVPTWHDMPNISGDVDDEGTVYQNGDARLRLEQLSYWDDPSDWVDNDGQVPFYSPGGRDTDTCQANEGYYPDETELDHAYFELGEWELVARWLRIFHDAELAEVAKIRTGYSQGDERKVLTIVTKKWREAVGVSLEQIVGETKDNSHLKDFAAWCAGDFWDVITETRDPNGYWDEVEHEIVAMDGPMHTVDDVNEWLEENAAYVDAIAEDIAGENERAGSWVI